jgi:hypothetical protein
MFFVDVYVWAHLIGCCNRAPDAVLLIQNPGAED